MNKVQYSLFFSDKKNRKYSIDNIIINFEINPKYYYKVIKFLREDEDTTYAENDTRLYHYKHLFTWKCKASTIRVELGLNGVSKIKGKIIVNPNKCFESDKTSGKAVDFLSFIYSLSVRFEFRYIDIAIDIPEKKSIVHLENHSYKKVSYITPDSNNKQKSEKMRELTKDELNTVTEYLGTLGIKTKDGFCRLYNKSIEAELEDDVVRFEMTIKLDSTTQTVQGLVSKILKKMPPVHIVRPTDLSCYENNKYKKYKDTIIALSQSDNPYYMIKTMYKDAEHKKKFSAYLQKEILSYINLEYIELEVNVLTELITVYFNIMQSIEEYDLLIIKENKNSFVIPDYFFEDKEVDLEDFPVLFYRNDKKKILLSSMVMLI